MLVDTEEDRVRIQQIALARIAEANDVPFSIKRADDRARIPHEAQNHLVGLLQGTEEVGDYNRDRRWGLGNGSPLAREPDINIPGDDSAESDEQRDELSTDQADNNL